jgi:hypothetical protein
MKTLTPVTGLLALAAAFCLAAVTACAPVTVTGAWRDAAYTQRIKKALVVGVFERPVHRRSLEDVLVEELKKQGVQAVSSYSLLPGDRMPDGETFQGEIQGVDVDAVLVTRLVDVEKETFYVPPHTHVVPHSHYYRRLHIYYGHAYYTLYEPGYLVERSIVSLETTLYDASTNRLVWILSTENFDPQNTKELVQPLARLIIERLKKERLI